MLSGVSGTTHFRGAFLGVLMAKLSVSLNASHGMAAVTSDFRSDCFGMTTWHLARKVFVLEFNNYKLSCGAEAECCYVGLWSLM